MDAVRWLRNFGVASVLACASFGCAGGGEEPIKEETGVLRMALVGTDSQGQQYRLRNADFEIYGFPEIVAQQRAGTAGTGGGEPPPWPPTAGTGGTAGASGGGDAWMPEPDPTGPIPGFPPFPPYDNIYYDIVSTEDDPENTEITMTLVPGYYDVSLISNNWYLERITADGAERVEQAVLLSSRYQGAYVRNNGTSRVYYRFGVDGEPVDFRSGELEIGIIVERPEDRGPGGCWPVGNAQCEDEEDACMADAGCAEIFECALATGCQGIGCYQPNTCQAVVDEHGGPLSVSANLAVALDACVNSNVICAP